MLETTIKSNDMKIFVLFCEKAGNLNNDDACFKKGCLKVESFENFVSLLVLIIDVLTRIFGIA